MLGLGIRGCCGCPERAGTATLMLDVCAAPQAINPLPSPSPSPSPALPPSRSLIASPASPPRRHNEIDEPMFTQPIMYQAIKRHKNALTIYQEKLAKEGSVPKDQVGCLFLLSFFLLVVGVMGAFWQPGEAGKGGVGAQGLCGGMGVEPALDELGWAAPVCFGHALFGCLP